MKITTVTMNPAIDKSSRIEHVVADRKLRCGRPVFEPGGGGINVSRAIRKLGGRSLALYPAGGAPGALFQELLEQEGLNHLPVAVNGWTRENQAIYEDATGRQFRFGMPGPELKEEEWRKCLDQVFQLDPNPEFVVASGSLPPGVPTDFYRRMAQVCKEKAINLVVDTSGEALREALEGGVFMAKPNMGELAAIAGRELGDEPEQEAFAGSLIESGKCRYLVISLGAAGVLSASPEGVRRLRAPTVSIKSKVGAGDSTVAGMVLKLSRGAPFIDAVKFGVAAGAAAVMTPGSELCRRSDAQNLYQKISGL